MIVIGAITALVGLETSVTAFNDEMAILPLGLSKILGITPHLNIPTSLPLYTMALGTVLAGFGWMMHIPLVTRHSELRVAHSRHA